MITWFAIWPAVWQRVRRYWPPYLNETLAMERGQLDAMRQDHARASGAWLAEKQKLCGEIVQLRTRLADLDRDLGVMKETDLGKLLGEREAAIKRLQDDVAEITGRVNSVAWRLKPPIDPNAKCPACGAEDGRLKFLDSFERPDGKLGVVAKAQEVNLGL
jgi:hypothetical protein